MMKAKLAVLTFGAIGLVACGSTATTTPKPTVPSECLTALNRADAAFDDVVTAFQAISTIFTDLSEADVDGALTNSDSLKGIGDHVGPIVSAYRTAAAACRAAG